MSSSSPPEHARKLSSIPVRLSLDRPQLRRGGKTSECRDSPEQVRHSKDAVYITKRLYSGFIEHVGRCIYGGVVGDVDGSTDESVLKPLEQAGSINEVDLQYRTDVMKDMLALFGVEQREWRTMNDGERQRRPLLRWPGGNYVSNYHWQDGIGPRSQRPARTDLAWHSIEPNHFGTDEFIAYCRLAGVEPYICLNMGTGTLEEALAWLEYCNGTGKSYWADLRRKNCGHDQPYNVKYWGLGNEMWADWQVNQLDAIEYTKMAKRWAQALKTFDPTIKLISCGKEGATEWDWTVLKGLTGKVDMHSIHFYSMLFHQKAPEIGEYEKNVFGPAAAEHYVHTCARLIDMAQIESDTASDARIGICYDEWNVWDDEKANAKNGLQQIYDYTDMLATVAWLHLLVRNADSVPVACMAQSVNVLSPLLTDGTRTLKQVTYYPVEMFARYMSDCVLLQSDPQPNLYAGKTFPWWISSCMRPAYVDVVASYRPQAGQVCISVLNRHPSLEWRSKILTEGLENIRSVDVYKMESDDLTATNTFQCPDTVVPSTESLTEEQWRALSGVVSVQAHSWSFIILTLQQ